MKQCDVIVVGGGMVGSAAALGLAQQKLTVQLIERSPLPHFDHNSDYDIRISAISAGSVKLLKQLNAWRHIQAMRTCPYKRLATWEIDGFETTFNAQDLGLSELGFMVENNVVQLGLWRAFEDVDTLSHSIGTIAEIQKCGQHWEVHLDNGEQFAAPLLVAADGANSQLRNIAHIGLSGWQYRQRCMLVLVNTELEQQDITWQQFHHSGPRAFLPLLGRKGCLVWYDAPADIQRLQRLPLDKLSDEIMCAFPTRLGRVQATQAASFELVRRHATDYYKDGIVLLGDAAHTINPLAGQGVNLGFKDVTVFLAVIEQAQRAGQDIASDATLARYERRRKPDNLLMQTGMDLFYKGFKEPLLQLKIARNLALLGVEKCTPLKNRALKYALGL
ncbi:2-octaprenyl-3-methyl-6-methoxy-1,4-benzoquinol hydroxylase [Pasteurellaceae bacterium HPA106]|uniref:FAD-dependent oxidoreductase n=1 Tax=Spirabiliibacterium pneumoniae TaxID=221400 RepID=UPI001AAD2CB2|nr:FAD-dependent oxidoreductase [Spirabiliibacterium pneumoniae]MBE2896959.1 2-octaprenyl-3-methyl-6-methoxy-1,4-benzoquinol hydroxylase [Spirabiliibacterium pneumoniae]